MRLWLCVALAAIAVTLPVQYAKTATPKHVEVSVFQVHRTKSHKEKRELEYVKVEFEANIEIEYKGKEKGDAASAATTTTANASSKPTQITEEENGVPKKKPAEMRLAKKWATGGQTGQPYNQNFQFGGQQQGGLNNVGIQPPQGGQYGPPPIYQMDEEGDENRQLLGALRQIKTDILAKSRQVRDDRRWVEQVKSVLVEYEIKMNRVVNHILLMRKEIKSLYKKKKQIENLMLQKKLEAKLKDASSDLTTLGDALDHVKDKEESFTQNKNEVESTINIIKDQLSKLKNGGAEAKVVNQDLSVNWMDPKAPNFQDPSKVGILQ